MRWSFSVGRLWGTEIRLHLLLLLLIPYIYWQYQPRSLLEGIGNLVLFVCLFLCILLHELGHTLFARLYGIQVKSILLWPLGGLASLSRQPQVSLEMLLIAAAGPLVNLLLGSGLLLISSLSGIVTNSIGMESRVREVIGVFFVDFPRSLGGLNLWLGLSNLLPIYPLDGGQILRSGLAMLVGRQRADWAALIVAVPLAFALAVFGVIQGDVLLVLVSLLLVVGAVSLRAGLIQTIIMFYLRISRAPQYYHLIGDFDSALDAYQRELNRTPTDPGILLKRAFVYLHLAHIDRAQADMERALAMAPRLPLARLLRGEFFMLSDQPEIALAWYNGVIRDYPDLYPAYADRGALALSQGRLIDALNDLNQAVKLNPHFFISFLLRSMVNYKLSRHQAVRQDWESALELSPREALIFPEYSRSMLDGNEAWSEAYYAWAIAHLPRSPNPYHGRGDARKRFGRLVEAVDDYSIALSYATNDARIYLERGRTFSLLGMLDAARQDFKMASSLARFSHLRRWAEEASAQISKI